MYNIYPYIYGCTQSETGQWAVYYTSPQSFIIVFLFVGFITLGTLVISVLIGCLIKLSVLTFQPLILMYRRGNFVYHH